MCQYQCATPSKLQRKGYGRVGHTLKPIYCNISRIVIYYRHCANMKGCIRMKRVISAVLAILVIVPLLFVNSAFAIERTVADPKNLFGDITTTKDAKGKTGEVAGTFFYYEYITPYMVDLYLERMKELGWTATPVKDDYYDTKYFFKLQDISTMIAYSSASDVLLLYYPKDIEIIEIQYDNGYRCVICDADGRCPICGGSGKWFDDLCFECRGNGVCPFCHGDGYCTLDENFRDVPDGVCAICGGSGICKICLGRGEFGGIATYGQGGSDSVDCSGCDGSGDCEYCEGTGKDLD